MKEQFEPITLTKNEELSRFELEYEGHTAFIEYKETSRNYALVHTESPEALSGTGAASALVEKTLHFVADAGKTVSPYCPFVYAYIKKHPEWKKIVSTHFPGYEEL